MPRALAEVCSQPFRSGQSHLLWAPFLWVKRPSQQSWWYCQQVILSRTCCFWEFWTALTNSWFLNFEALSLKNKSFWDKSIKNPPVPQVSCRPLPMPRTRDDVAPFGEAWLLSRRPNFRTEPIWKNMKKYEKMMKNQSPKIHVKFRRLLRSGCPAGQWKVKVKSQKTGGVA